MRNVKVVFAMAALALGVILAMAAQGTPGNPTRLKPDQVQITVPAPPVIRAGVVLHASGAGGVFTLPEAAASGTLMVFRNGVLQAEGGDYTAAVTAAGAVGGFTLPAAQADDGVQVWYVVAAK